MRDLGMIANVAVALAVLSGCSPSSDGAPSGQPGSSTLHLSGQIVDPQSAPDAEVVVIWAVGEDAYKTGGVRAVNGAFALSQMAPPDAALSGGLGIGFVVALAPGKSLPDGLVTDPSALGDQHALVMGTQALIYRATSTSNPLESGTWPASFSPGLSCAKCVRASSGFDAWAPAPCEPFELAPLPTDQQCNWT